MGKAGSKRHKLGKIAIVLFLTVLIWVWADLELDETPPERGAVIQIDESANEAIWVSFGHKASIDIRITLSGPHTAFLALDRELRSEGRKLAFVFDAEQEHMTEAGKSHSLRVLDFVQQNKRLKDLGLKVESCVPEIIDVNVVALIKIPLPVECFREDGQPLDVESIEPATVEMFVPEGTRTARVRLGAADIDQARLVGVEKTPFIVLAEGLTKQATSPVRIMISSEQSRLPEYSISPATFDIAMSQAMWKKYDPNVTNLTQVRLPITIRATEEAKRRYKNQQLPHMTLHIFDSDESDGKGSREMVYNFPEELVRSGEIKLVENPSQPAMAKFKLMPLTRAD